MKSRQTKGERAVDYLTAHVARAAAAIDSARATIDRMESAQRHAWRYEADCLKAATNYVLLVLEKAQRCRELEAKAEGGGE